MSTPSRDQLKEFFTELSKNEEYWIKDETLQDRKTDLHSQSSMDFYTFVADRVNDLGYVHQSTQSAECDKKLQEIFAKYRQKDKIIAEIEELVSARDSAAANLLFMRGMREAVYMLIQIFDDHLLD